MCRYLPWWSIICMDVLVGVPKYLAHWWMMLYCFNFGHEFSEQLSSQKW
jgi:hypothetical protein